MKFSWRTEWLQWLVIAAMFLSAALAWSHVPERTPIHWNFKGEVDGYGGRFAGLLLLPIVALGNYGLFLLVPLIDPGGSNYANFSRPYAVVRNGFILVLGILHGACLAAGLGYHFNFAFFAFAPVGVLLIALGNVLGKVRPNWFFGFRSPWTLSSRASWNKSNRACGWVMMLWGVLTIVLSFVQSIWMFMAWLAFIVIALIGMLIYSYVIYRNDPHRTTPAGIAPADNPPDPE